MRDINAASIDDFYYENLGFDATAQEARRLRDILDKLTMLLQDEKRPKIIGHEAIHLVLLVDALLDDYTLKPMPKDPLRAFGLLDRELIYYRDKKRCAVCEVELMWSEVEIHHVQLHSAGGQTVLENGAPVHKECHPKSAVATAAFAKRWAQRLATV